MGGNGKENKRGASQQCYVTYSATLTVRATLKEAVNISTSGIHSHAFTHTWHNRCIYFCAA